jgi:hypothetical protein
MGPKVESALRFLHGGGKECIITSAERIGQAVSGSAGTHIFANPDEAGREEARPTGNSIGGPTK